MIPSSSSQALEGCACLFRAACISLYHKTPYLLAILYNSTKFSAYYVEKRHLRLWRHPNLACHCILHNYRHQLTLARTISFLAHMPFMHLSFTSKHRYVWSAAKPIGLAEMVNYVLFESTGWYPSWNRLWFPLLLGSKMPNHLISAIVANHFITQIHVHFPSLVSVLHILTSLLSWACHFRPTSSTITCPYIASFVSNVVVCSSLVCALKFPMLSSYKGAKFE